jgi:hypothetical protein
MEWKSISEDELKGLKLASRAERESSYEPLFKAVEKGPVRIDAPADGKLQALKWRLGRAIKKAGLQITMATLADKSGVILTKATPETPKK